MSDSTFGDFYDEVEKIPNVEAAVHMEMWVALVDDAKWQEVRASALTEEWVRCFAEDMMNYWRERMQGICTDALYESAGRRGREFMDHIKAVAKGFGYDIAATCDAPATLSEALTRRKA